MDEKEMELKQAKVQVESVQRDIENKNRELEDFQHKIEMCNFDIKHIGEQTEIFEGVLKLMMLDYGKVESAIEHKWENNSEYWELMKRKQLIEGEKKIKEFEATVRNLERTVKSAEDQIDGITIALKMDEDLLKRRLEEVKKLEGE